MSKMKIHLYQVMPQANTPNVDVVFGEALNSALVERLRFVGKNEVRLEAIEAPRSSANPSDYWLFDFTRLRFEHGPGKASRTEAIEGFDLNADEGFGEETAMLYDQQTGYACVQYNHFGVRSGTIQQYLSVFTIGQTRVYEFRAKLDETSELKLAQKQILTKIQFKVAPSNMTGEQRRAGVSLSRALDLSDQLNGQAVEITISNGGQKNAMLNSGAVGRIVDTLRTLAQRDAEQKTVNPYYQNSVVQKFEITGKQDAAEAAETIDMLIPKVEQELDGIVLGADLRYTRQSRRDALIRARNGWQALIRP